MRDLIKLSKKYYIEAKIYNGNALEITYKMIGDGRVSRWLESICDEGVSDEQSWEIFIKFLEKEMRVLQKKFLFIKKQEAIKKKQNTTEGCIINQGHPARRASSNEHQDCSICYSKTSI